VTRHKQLLRVEGVWDAPNRGVLCEAGRFDVVATRPARLRQPMMRGDGVLSECTWEQALAAAASGLKRASSVAGLITARSTDETLVTFSRFFHDVLGSSQVSLISGRVPPLNIGTAATLQDVSDADTIAVIAKDPLESHRVLQYLIRGAVDRGTRLIVCSDAPTDLDAWAERVVRLSPSSSAPSDPHEALRLTSHVRLDRLAEVRAAIEAAQRPVVVYGSSLDESLQMSLRTLPSKVLFLPLVEGPNAVGAARFGIGVQPVAGEAVYAIVSDEPVDHQPLPEASFRVVQSSFHNRWTEQADVALPSKIWYEKQGHITGFGGQRLTLTRPVDAPQDLLNDWQSLFLLSVLLGKPLNCVGVSITSEVSP
jgi:formate dehydrogenase major subunit